MHEPEAPRVLSRGERLRLALGDRIADAVGTGGVLAVLLVLCLFGYAAARWAGLIEPGRPAATAQTPFPMDGGPLADVVAGGPFAGTLADSYPAGADGIVLPEAKPIGPFTARQVATALNDVKQALVASRIDRRIIVDHDPKVFLALLSPASRDELELGLQPGVAPWWANQVAKSATLTQDVPRVKGMVTYRSIVLTGGVRILEVTAKFVWVYAFDHVSEWPDGDLVTVADKTVWHIRHPDDAFPASTGLRLHDGDSVAWNVDCETFRDGYLSPLTDVKAAAEVAPDDAAGDPAERFDPGQSLEGGDSC